jgi:hypothetical protein
MWRASLAIVALVAGYAAGALIGAVLIEFVSGNRHDKSLEAAMTGAFVTGPLGALVGLIVALWWRRPS